MLEQYLAPLDLILSDQGDKSMQASGSSSRLNAPWPGPHFSNAEEASIPDRNDRTRFFLVWQGLAAPSSVLESTEALCTGLSFHEMLARNRPCYLQSPEALTASMPILSSGQCWDWSALASPGPSRQQQPLSIVPRSSFPEPNHLPDFGLSPSPGEGSQGLHSTSQQQGSLEASLQQRNSEHSAQSPAP